MSSLPLVVVVGATGQQGGSVVRYLSATGKYQIRALTRDPTKQTDIAKLPNVTLAEFDYGKPNTYNEAFKGDAYAVFGVTNFWDPAVMNNHKLEVEWGKRLVDACVDNHVKYFIWSTLPPCKQISKGKYDVPHFDNKAEVADYARSKTSLKCIFVHATWYLQNFEQMTQIMQMTENGYNLALPLNAVREVDYFDVTDIGKVVVAILESPEKHINRDILASAGLLTGKSVAEAFTRVTGVPTSYTDLPRETFLRNMPPGMGDELATMCEFFSEFGYHGGRYDDTIARKELNVKFNSLENWVSESKFAKQI